MFIKQEDKYKKIVKYQCGIEAQVRRSTNKVSEARSDQKHEQSKDQNQEAITKVKLYNDKRHDN